MSAIRKRDFNRLVKQARKAGIWDPVGCVKALIKAVEKERKISPRTPSRRQ